jgi:uncharacterized protein YndB with AHSA1/START domain
MFKKIIIIVVVLIAAVLGYAAMQPDTFEIRRTTNIQASPEQIFPLLNDLQQAQAWSPYEKKDPAMQRRFSGAESGKGSVYEFEGNKEVGSGRLEILESIPPAKVTISLDMYEPFAGSNTVEYILEPKDSGTDVTWAMHGAAPFISKVICLFMDMDQMVGKDFEAGLASLKSLVESSGH